MNQLKLISFAFLSVLFLSSCDKSDTTQFTPDTSRYISNYNFFLSGAQVVPVPTTSTATGTIQGTYDRKTKLYSYVLTWAGLTSNVTAIHIHGIADAGYVALPSPLGPYTNGIVQAPTGFPTAKAGGSYTGNLYVDGLVIKESDLLASKFYVDIHTTTYPVTTLGEIRAQIIFPQ
jgi:hypothetical protein